MFARRYFIVAPKFHGTTLLSKLLNDHPDIVSLGDTYPSNRIDQVCGCGEYVSGCPFWTQVARHVGARRYRQYPSLLPYYPEIIGRRTDRLVYNIFGPRLLECLIARSDRGRFSSDFLAFESAVYTHSGRPATTVFVDGVKSISRIYALIASGVHIDGVIHLHRDPGDYMKSTMRQKNRSSWSVSPDLVKYRLFHRLARRTADWVPYCSVTYEGLADDPAGAMDALFRFVQVTPKPVADLVSKDWRQPWHFMGNASLFGFDGTIRRSQHELSRTERWMSRLLGGSYDWQEIHLASQP